MPIIVVGVDDNVAKCLRIQRNIDGVLECQLKRRLGVCRVGVAAPEPFLLDFPGYAAATVAAVVIIFVEVVSYFAFIDQLSAE